MARIGMELVSLLLLNLLLVVAVTARVVDSWVYEKPEIQYTDRPVIAILTLPEPACMHYGSQSLVSSNVRWMLAGGARVVPVFYDSTDEELDYILNRVNGIFLTGGAVSYNPNEHDPAGSSYLRTTERILSHLQKENERGNYFPLWGTCLGFERVLELIAVKSSANVSILDEFDAENYPINLHFTEAAWKSRLFGSMSHELFTEVASPLGRLAFNNHGLGIYPETLSSNRDLSNEIAVLTVDLDRNGKAFVSTIEGKNAPIYGSQWHPEKPPSEWNPDWQISHSEKAIEMSNFMGRFFVNECKYNKNHFEDDTTLRKYLLTDRVALSGAALLEIDPNLDMPFTEIYCFENLFSRQTSDQQLAAKLLAEKPKTKISITTRHTQFIS